MAHPAPVSAPSKPADAEAPRVSRPFAAVFLGGMALAYYLVRPFGPPLFLAATMAVATYPLYSRLTKLLRGRAQLAGGLLTFALFAFILAPLASVVAIGVQEVTQGLQWIRDALGIDSLRDLSLSNLPPKVEQGLAQGLQYLHISRPDLQEYASRSLGYVRSVAPTALGLSVDVVGGTLMVLAAFYFFMVDGKRVADFTCRISPLPAGQTEELFEEFRSVSTAALLGSVVTSVLISAVVGIGLAVAQVPHALFFSILSLFAGFIPVVGSAIVWVPAATILMLTSRLGAGIGLMVWCAVGVALADNIVKPMLMRGKSEIHVGLMFLGLLGGIAAFGAVGIIAGPVCMAFFLALLRIYARDYVR